MTINTLNRALIEDACVFNEPDCGEPVMLDESGEPWCQRCKDRYRAEELTAGRNDPERPLQ